MATEIIWLEPGEDSYDPSTQQAQWGDIIPPFSLPPSKILVMPKGPYKVTQVLARGTSHVTKFDLLGLPQPEADALANAGRTYNDPMGNLTQQQFNLPDRGSGSWVPPDQVWPNVFNTQFWDWASGQTEPITPQQGAEKGAWFSTYHNMVIWENSENVHAISSHWPFVKSYFDVFMPRIQARFAGKPVFVGWNYFSGISQRPDWMSRADAKQRLRDPLSSWPGNPMLPGGNLEKTTLSCLGFYLNEPGSVHKMLYMIPYSGALNKKANKYMVTFIQSVHEWFPNNFYAVTYPEGVFYRKDKLPINPNFLYSIAVLSYIYGAGIIGYAFDAKKSHKNLVRQYAEGGLWFPNGSGTPQSLDTFPHWVPESSPYYTRYTGSADMAMFGVQDYAATWGQTEGGVEYYCDFRLDGGSWTTAQNAEMDDIVDATHDERGWVHVRILGSVMSVLYINPCADNANHTLEFRHPTNPSATFTQTVSTCIAHVCNISI